MKTLYTLVDKIRFKTVFCDVKLRPHCYDRASVAFCLSRATVLKVSGFVAAHTEAIPRYEMS